jgi:hypothetical protein
MEGISPSLKLALSLKYSLESGDSVRIAVREYLKKNSDELSLIVAAWMARKEQGRGVEEIYRIKNPYRRALLDCIEQGFRGEGILPTLKGLESEIIDACNEEIDRFASLLPLKALAPLLLLQFPALFLLFFAPLLSQLTHSL